MAVTPKWNTTQLQFSHSFEAHSLPFSVRFESRPRHFAHATERVLFLDRQISTLPRFHRNHTQYYRDFTKNIRLFLEEQSTYQKKNGWQVTQEQRSENVSVHLLTKNKVHHNSPPDEQWAKRIVFAHCSISSCSAQHFTSNFAHS